MASWLTDHPQGFGDWEIDALTGIQKRLAVACKVLIKEQVAQYVLDAYFARSAGERVLNGHLVQRSARFHTACRSIKKARVPTHPERLFRGHGQRRCRLWR